MAVGRCVPMQMPYRPVTASAPRMQACTAGGRPDYEKTASAQDRRALTIISASQGVVKQEIMTPT